MSDANFFLLHILRRRWLLREGADEPDANRFTESTLERHKLEGFELAIRARWIALAIIAIMLPFLNPTMGVLYYEACLLALAIVPWIQRRYAHVGYSRAELLLLFIDLTLATFVLVFPNPFGGPDWPASTIYRFENFLYFFVFVAAATLAYSWRTIISIGTWIAILWLLAAGLVWWFQTIDSELAEAARTAFGGDPALLKILDPNNVQFDLRVQEVVVFLIVSFILALTVRRFNRLLLGNAQLERERANLSRYFSPNVVNELSLNDEPLKQIREHEVAVLFVDIVGFTRFAADRDPHETIGVLRDFHARMEAEVFHHGGTLDKYLGDGLMATFGTPLPTERDAVNALRCARAMIAELGRWNAERRAAGEAEIKGSFGLHFGPVVLGDIGGGRLEFAVIGNTVNVASRLEGLTRALGVEMVISESLHATALLQSTQADVLLANLDAQPPQAIRGLEEPLKVWTLPRA